MHIWDLMGTGSRTTIGVGEVPHPGGVRLHLLRPVRHPLSRGRACTSTDDTGKVLDALADPDKITVVQMAPAVRVAWAEYYHLTAGVRHRRSAWSPP